MKLSSLVQGLEITETNIENFDIEIAGVSDDSNCVDENEIFVALCGQNRNGHKFIDSAVENGASVIVCEKPKKNAKYRYIKVKNTRIALSVLWNNLCDKPTGLLKFIGVTGTNGKTSTVKMIEHILRSNGIKCESIGTLNAPLTTPDPEVLYPMLKEFTEDSVEYVIMEVSSHSLYYDKVYPIDFKIGVFTNLTPEHLDFHGSMYEYAKAKAKLFSRCECAVYNYDDKFASLVCESAPTRISYSSKSDNADYTAKEIKLGFSSIEYLLVKKGEIDKIKLPLIGSFNVCNSMASIITSQLLGIDCKTAVTSLSALPKIPGRTERVQTDDNRIIFIDYAHTPDAMEKVLCVLRECTGQGRRLVCVFGCGGDRDKSKRPKMGAIASRLADYCIITSDNPRSEDPYGIIKDIVGGITEKNYLIIAERKRAIEYAVRCARDDDVIVFLGKGHEKYEINMTGKIPFDERKYIEEALKR